MTEPTTRAAAPAIALLVALLASGPTRAQSQEQVPPQTPQAQAPLTPQEQHSAATYELPLWELGLGAGAVAFRDYRGSDTTHAYPVPFGYFVYRGRYLQADRNGLKTKLLRQDRVELNISLNATTPVRNNAARQGMPELRPTVEIGPALDVHIWRSAERLKLDVRLPVRVVSTIGRPGYIGWFFAPNVNADIRLAGWNLGLLTGPLFAAQKYNAYDYSVPPQYATPQRPAYQASGGYAGTQVLASLTKRYPKFWAGAYVRHDTLTGASFENSPLVRSHNYWSGGIGIAWIVGHSSHLVEVPKSEEPGGTCNGCSSF